MKTDAIPRGQRVFTCAHSFHDFVPDLLVELATAAGIHGHVMAGLSSIGGSQVIQHWDVPDTENKAKACLSAGLADVLTLSPIWLPDQGIENLVKLGVAHRPDLRVTMQQYWLPNDEYRPVYPLEVGKFVDHNLATVARLRECHDSYLNDIKNVASMINTGLGKKVILVVPVGQAVVALREKIIANQVPSIGSQSDLFTDSWGHVAEPVKVLSAYCHFVTIYQKDPAGLPVPKMMCRPDRPAWADEDLNRLLQKLAWDAVNAEPMSGLRRV